MATALLVVLIATAAAAVGCGGTDQQGPRAASNPGETAEGQESPDRWGVYRSKRFALVLHLPGGSEWRVDDRSRAELVAIHQPTKARLFAARWTEFEQQNHASCEVRARARNLLPPASAVVVDEAAAFRSDGEDEHTWVAIEPGADAAAPLRGHAVAVGAHGKKCWAVHYVTEVPSAKQEDELSTRLARAREGTIARVGVGNLEDVPRERRAP